MSSLSHSIDAPSAQASLDPSIDDAPHFIADPCAISRARANPSSQYRTPSGVGPSPARARRLIELAKAERMSKVRTARRATPARPRARQARSPASHGRSRKDVGGDSGDGLPQTADTRVYRKLDGGVCLEQDMPGPDAIFVAEFSTVAEAARGLLAAEQRARGAGAWIGPSFLDETHPLYLLINEGLQ